jgi:exopolyphosphatase/pppGpp-phosphohydrolase
MVDRAVRKRLKGMAPRHVDSALPADLFLHVLLASLSLAEVTVSPLGLREGGILNACGWGERSDSPLPPRMARARG